MKRTLALAVLGVALVLVGIGRPMVLIFPMWIFASLGRRRMSRLTASLPMMASFLIWGVLFGLLTETFAIMENLGKPAQERILLNPHPYLDLVFGFFYYLLVIGAWALLLRSVKMPAAAVFVISGLYGVAVEQNGKILMNIAASPGTGVPMAVLVACVYGIFPMLGYQTAEDQTSSNRAPARFWHYLLAPLALFLQYVLYGLVILPSLHRAFGKS